MLKLLAFLLLLLSFFPLHAQVFQSDSVRAGIKSVTINICGYSGSGDSTGLDRFAYREFDANGRIKKKIQRPVMLVETQVLPGEKYEMSSWYFESESYTPGVFDSLWYKYNSSGQITETRWNTYDNGKGKSVRTYDAKGKCIKEQSYSKGVATTWTKYEYDARGLKVAVTSGDGKIETMHMKFVYDSLGRLTKRENRYTAVRGDSISYSYGDHVVTQKVMGPYPGTTTTYYSSYDSIMKRYYSRPGPYRTTVTDTTEYLRDSVTHKVLSISERHYYGNYVKTYTYDKDGRVTRETREEGSIVTMKKYNWNSEGRIARKENYMNNDLEFYETFTYNVKGDLVEYRMYTGSDRLVHREVYVYTYY